jgi:hypothetical protein
LKFLRCRIHFHDFKRLLGMQVIVFDVSLHPPIGLPLKVYAVYPFIVGKAF